MDRLRRRARTALGCTQFVRAGDGDGLGSAVIEDPDDPRRPGVGPVVESEGMRKQPRIRRSPRYVRGARRVKPTCLPLSRSRRVSSWSQSRAGRHGRHAEGRCNLPETGRSPRLEVAVPSCYRLASGLVLHRLWKSVWTVVMRALLDAAGPSPRGCRHRPGQQRVTCQADGPGMW